MSPAPVTALGEQTTLWDRKRRAGQRLLLRLSGPGLRPEARALIRELVPGGFVLDADSAEEPAALRELCRELVDLVPDALPPVLAATHHGGRQLVDVVRWPLPLWVGNVDAPEQTRALGRALGQELSALGLNLCLGPPSDVEQLGGDGVLTGDCLGRGPERVARHLVAWGQGLAAAGVGAAPGPFPGRGPVRKDGGEGLQLLDKDAHGLEQEDFLPLKRAIEAGVRAVHLDARLMAGDIEEISAALSQALVTDWLRGRLGFAGLVVALHLDAPGIDPDGSRPRRYELACRAGCDLLVVEADLHMQADAFDILVRLQEEDPAQHDRAKDTSKRLHTWREAVLPGRLQAPMDLVGSEAHKHLALGLVARGRP